MTGYSKVTAYFVGGLVITGALFLFVVNPFLKKVAAVAGMEQDAKTELQVLEQQLLAYNTARSDLSKAENKDLLYTFFVDEKNLKLPIEEIEAAAKRTGSAYQLKIHKDTLTPTEEVTRRGAAARQLEAEKVTKQDTLEEVPYTLSIQDNSYIDILNFFQYVENIPHFTEISGIDASFSEDSEIGSNIINVVIDGVFLVKKNADQTK